MWIEGFDADNQPIIDYAPKPRVPARVKVSVIGKQRLEDATWVEFTNANKALLRFFRVRLEEVPLK